MADSKRKLSNSKKAQMQKKASADKKNNKNNTDTSGYAADHEDVSAQKKASSKSKNKNRSPKKIQESSEEESASGSEKQTSVASTSTSNNNNINNSTASHEAHLESNGTHDQSEQERKKKKKHRRSFGKWRPFRRQEVIDSDDSADSDEEKSYIRSIRERVTLEEFERKATRELREKIEQARINRRFFLSTRRTPEQQVKHHKMQHLICANLFNPPREYTVDEKLLLDYDVHDKALQAEALRALTVEDEEQLVTFQHRTAREDELAVPTYRDISAKYADSYLGYDAAQTEQFWRAYQSGYIVHDTEPIEMEVEPPLFQDKMPRRKHSDPALRRASSAGVVPEKVTRVSKFFHPHRWSKVELDWVRALLAVYGAEWPRISKLMCRAKQPPALQSAYARSGGVLDEHHVTVQSMEVLCGLCQQARDNKRMVFCTCCDRAYHLKCLDPPLSRIPNEWFCSPMCASVVKTKCELCASATDDDKMLLCDACDRGYHMYCLPVPLTEVPAGDWYCASCAQERGIVVPAAPVPTESRAATAGDSTPQNASEDSEAHARPLIPITCVLTSTQHSTAPRSVIHKHWLLAQFSLLAESAPLCRQHYTPHTSLPWLPLKQPPVLALHDSATQLLHSARVTYAQLRQLRQYCVTCLLHAAVEMVPGASIDLSRLPVPDRSIFTQRIRPAERTLEALQAHFTHHIHACVAAVDRVERNSLKKRLHKSPSLKALKKPRVSFAAETEAAALVTPVKKPPVLKRRKSEGDAYKKEYTRKKCRAAPADEYTELPAKSTKRAKPHPPLEHEQDDGYEAGAPRYWVFQANPNYYDINASLQELRDMTWLIKQQTNKIHLGDKVFIWESGKNAGVLAVGSVTTEPAVIDEIAGMAKFTCSNNLGAAKELRAQVHVDYVLPTRVSKETVLRSPVLAHMTIIRAPIGTNFRITRNQAYHLEKLVLATSEGEFTALYDHSADKDEAAEHTVETAQSETTAENGNNTTVAHSAENNTNVMRAETKNSTESNDDAVMSEKEEKVTPVKHESVTNDAETTHSTTLPSDEANNSSTKSSANHHHSPLRATETSTSNNNHASSPPSRKRQHELTAEDLSPNKRRRTLPRAASQRRVFNADDFLPDEALTDALTEEMMRDTERHVTPVTPKPETPVAEPSVPASGEVTPADTSMTPVTAQPLHVTQALDTDVDPDVACVICRSWDTSVQVQHVTGPVTFAQELLKCHACQAQYHTHCIVPALAQRTALDLHAHHWLCPTCGLTRDELTRVRTSLVLLELHFELRRLLREECEQIYFATKQSINSASETDEVTSALQTRVTALEQLTRDATRAATESFRAWNSQQSVA